jgi:N-acetylglucosaminyl-diphospho-decaprenol L-rhamnosyltransferase
MADILMTDHRSLITDSSAPPDVSVVILAWNVRDLLRACLASLPAGDPRVEVIVVDAGSVDGSAEMVRAEFPAVHLIARSENLGYSRGNNLGLAAARGRYLFVLNPDTEVVGDALPRLAAYMDANPQVGLLGPQLVWPDGTVQPSRRRFPTLVMALFESTWLQRLAPPGLLPRYYAADLPLDRPARMDWVTGAALFVRRAAYEAVGGLDESFFMYSEELDWQRRLRAADWEVVYFPEARIVHHEARSSAQVPAATHIRYNTSKVRYFRKYHGRLAGEVLRWYLLGHFAVQLALEWAKGLVGHKPALRRERVAAYREVLRSGLRG